MSLILRYLIGRKATPPLPPNKLSQELKEVKQQLNSILTKWTFGDKPIKTSEEFLNQFEPWINKQMEQRKELQEFLNEQGASNLPNLKETLKNNEADYLRRIDELKEGKETPEDYTELETERDEAIREKKTLEQDLLATNNRLNLKVQEIKNKEKTIENLKKEKSQSEIALNKKLKEEKQMNKGNIERINLLTKQKQELQEEIEQLKKKK